MILFKAKMGKVTIQVNSDLQEAFKDGVMMIDTMCADEVTPICPQGLSLRQKIFGY